MKSYLYLIVLLLFTTNVNAYWQTYQNDLRNTGIANGTGYFPLETSNFSNELYGMNFQPLVDDFNNDGWNEIIIFSNDFLKIFDYELNLIDERYVGNILGQPTVFNNNIIFNSRQKNYPSDNFFVYGLNNLNLYQVFNLTLNNAADFSGIKCLNLGVNSCIFKDKLNYVHIIDIDSKIDNSYNTSAYNETRQTIPAIGDIDNDGNDEAVFWFNNDSGGGYGFLAFDLIEKKVDLVVDNIFSPFGINYVLKGQPVLIDLNNDNKLEIAVSVFYDDSCNGEACSDWFTELFVYNASGSKLFSKCQSFFQEQPNNCNDGSSEQSKWEGTNPFVMDINNDNVNEICFVKDKKLGTIHMSLNCYNYFGDLLLDSGLSPTTDTVKTAVVADMNNDGKKEIITENKIYALNGTSIFSYDLGTNFVIPVDLDNNNRLDLLWTKQGATKSLIDDTGAIKVSSVLIKPEAPSVEDSLSCQWNVDGDNKLISANVSWYKNSEFYDSENVACVNATLCLIKNNIQSSALNENDIWKCSVTIQKSLPRSDVAMIFASSSEWTSFNKNQLSYGISSGNGYFSSSAINTIVYNSSGSLFQPMIADIDNNGENEIAVFSNNSLMLFNKSLNIIAQKQVGNLRGQFDIENMDNDSFIEIIAVVNNSNKDNFTIFEFNGSNFKIETSFDVSSQNGAQDIRCLDFDKDNIKECMFRDFNGIVHSYQINAASQFDDELNVNISDTLDNVYSSNVNIAPSFVDFDRDNELDALFWFNDNFVVIDANKNIILNVDVGTLSNLFRNEPTLLGLKFVNLDKAGNYEIAVAYRHDYINVRSKTDINLTLFNSKGNQIFSKIIDFYNANPCFNDITPCFGIGSDLIVYDYNKDGFDDIGIYVEGTFSSPFGTFIKFFDRNGNEIASNKVELNEGSSIAQSIALADMDNDNELELILKRRIYNLDGTALYNFTAIGDFASAKSPIVFDIDKNKALDLLWFDSNKLILLFDNNSYTADLFIEEKDISFSSLNSTSVIVTANVHNNGGLNVNNVKVKLINTETLESVNGTISVRGNSMNNFTAILNLKKHDKVMAQVNYDDSIEESDDKNNFAEKMFEGLVYVYVFSNVDPLNVNSEFQDYIKNKLTSGYYTANENEADVKVYIGKNNLVNILNKAKTLSDFEFGYDYGNVMYYDKTGTMPYSALIGSFKDIDGKIKIMIVGNEIEGDIAGTKEFIKSQALFLSTTDKNAIFVDDENAEAVKVFDYLHLGGNNEHYKVNNEQFKTIVRNALNDEMFNEANYNVTTSNNVVLRLKNLKPNISSDYLEYLNSNGVPVEIPVVLAHGLFSNLTTWEVLGAEISNTGRDTWLIEITGGPNQDCDDCIDYTFYNLTDIFVPALLNGVLNFTGKSNLQYVGFSNGCRSALDSLERGMFDSSKVETFVAVGCPGSFNHSSSTDSASPISKVLNKDGGMALISFRNKNLKHVSFSDLAKEIIGIERFFDSKIKISVNLFQQYYNWSIETSDKEPGENVIINKFFVIQGNLFTNSDGVVSTYDTNATYLNINANKKKYINIPASHLSLDDSTRTKVFVRKILNNESFTTLENLIFVLKSEP